MVDASRVNWDAHCRAHALSSTTPSAMCEVSSIVELPGLSLEATAWTTSQLGEALRRNGAVGFVAPSPVLAPSKRCSKYS